MLASTEGIVLHFIKYGESSVISTIFTKEFGRQSYLINAARSKRSKNKAALLQPLFFVDLVAYQRQTHDLHRIKEMKAGETFQNIPFDIVKSSQAIFLSEILYKTISEQESYPEMFEFIKNALLYFDLMEKGAVNFHLYFLYRLTEYLGFLPNTSSAGFEGWWDLRNGTVVPFEPSHPLFANKETTRILRELSTLKIHEISKLAITRNQRETLLSKMVEYYQLHFDSLGEIKSLEVMRDVFE
ncbi:MAG: DNA repair protein RecO [Prolixibacteraceae bacterium]|nr:DNA repair protein RecO [Prolixibacteraceae bacterium]